jgi:uncharacterized membrane protein
MGKGRVEAFSDGVVAILITIMVLELKVPHSAELAAIKPLLPVLLCYVLSFVYIGIYWNNHHHLLKTVKKTNGAMMWANHHLLFWLSLFPFATAWMGENHFASTPSALYGGVLFMAAVAYYILQGLIIAEEGGDKSKLGRAIGSDWKGKLSPALYATGIAASFFLPWVAACIYAIGAALWLIPDRRLAEMMGESKTARRSR